MSRFDLYAPFEKVTKQDDGSLLIAAVVSSEAIDTEGEWITHEAMKAAIPDYMQWANVREMHQPSAVGVTLDLRADDADRRTYGLLHVVDPAAISKVEAGVYKGVSVGGKKMAKPQLLKRADGLMAPALTEVRVVEISLVDRPSNPEARFTILKAADLPEDDMDPATLAAEPAAADVAKAAEPEAPAATTEPEPLAKTWAVSVAADILSSIEMLLSDERWEQESGARDETGDIASLTSARDAVAAFIGHEAQEPAEDEAAGAADVVVEAAAAATDLAKAAPVVDLAPLLAEFAAFRAEIMGELTKTAEASDLAKVATPTFDITPVVTATDAMKGEILAALKPLKEELAKVAAQPANGGPLRYFERGGQVLGQAPGAVEDDPASALVKAAGLVSDPRLQEQLRQHAAALQVRSLTPQR